MSIYSRPIVFLVAAVAVISVGTLITTFIPLLRHTNVEAIEGIKPYNAIELTGRDVYIREGCNNCHTQTVRPLLFETERYGDYSRGGEFVYDTPHMFGTGLIEMIGLQLRLKALALADENRTRIMLFIGDIELCVCQIIEMLGLAPSTVSKHLTILHQAGLVESRKDGRWIYYRVKRNGSPEERNAIQFLRRSLEGDARVIEDQKHLKAVLKMGIADLCCRYKE